MPDPVRLKLRRTARFNLQEASRAINGLPARSCARPHVLGNPFGWQTPQLGEHSCRAHAVRDHRRWLDSGAIPSSHRSQRAALAERRDKVWALIPSLVGVNLGCWCGLDQACHVDYLLELARRFHHLSLIRDGAREFADANPVATLIDGAAYQIGDDRARKFGPAMPEWPPRR